MYNMHGIVCILYFVFGANAIKNILILGGNGFIGSHLVNLLSDEGHRLTLLNRGNNYFNSDKHVTPYIEKVLACDRDTLLRTTCPGLLGKTYYDVVVDFSSHHEQQIEQAIDILKGRVGIYVFISSDAVYEVSAKHHSGKTREEDSKNEPKDNKVLRQLLKDNKYGAAKKACEERLAAQRDRLGFPYVILRLADVIGERDTTNRWWTYQIWVRIHKEFNTSISLPKGVKDHKFSLVYVGDVVQAIAKVVDEPDIFHDKVINLAFREEVTLASVLREIADYYKIEDVVYDNNDEIGFFRYPTGQRGPLDVTNAEILLKWSPISFREAVVKTIEFFDDAMVNPTYSKEREIVLAEFIEETLPESFDNETLFIRAMTNIYSPAVFNGVDIGLSFESEDLIEGRTEL